MPNYCSYSMQVTGKEEDVDFFIEELKTDYYYDKEHNCQGVKEGMRHFCRVFDADVLAAGVNSETLEDGKEIYLKKAVLTGNCAWSITSCMMNEGRFGYYQSLKETYGNKSKATTLAFESKRLNLIVEIYSEETGVGFSEHILYVNGEEIENECVDYYEIWYDENDEELDEPITRGGFENWEFTDRYDQRLAQILYDKDNNKTTLKNLVKE